MPVCQLLPNYKMAKPASYQFLKDFPRDSRSGDFAIPQIKLQFSFCCWLLIFWDLQKQRNVSSHFEPRGQLMTLPDKRKLDARLKWQTILSMGWGLNTIEAAFLLLTQRPGFDSGFSQKFVWMLLWFIDGTGWRKVITTRTIMVMDDEARCALWPILVSPLVYHQAWRSLGDRLLVCELADGRKVHCSISAT